MIQVHYKKGFGILIAALAGVVLVLNLTLFILGTVKILQFLLGLFLLFAAFSYLTKPIFELRENELVLLNMFGMPLKRHRFDRLSDFQVTDDKITLSQNGNLIPIKINKTLARSDEWELFLNKITNA